MTSNAINTSTFEVYRLRPRLVKEMANSRLTWSVKQLLDAYPSPALEGILNSFETWLDRLLAHQVDGCDFGIHHQLVCSLLHDNFTKAEHLIRFAGDRSPILKSSSLTWGNFSSPEEESVYSLIFSINDLREGDLVFTPPSTEKSERVQRWLEYVRTFLQEACPTSHAEIDAFQPIWLLAAVKEGSRLSFGGYSSSLALGTIALNVELSSFASVLIQVVHEIAHQLLFALAAETPLVFNHAAESFPSPLRKDKRPMDGVIHASFVSARVHNVLGQIEQSAIWHELAEADQRQLQQQRDNCREAVKRSLPTIDAEAKLSALGERVVNTIRGAIPTP